MYSLKCRQSLKHETHMEEILKEKVLILSIGIYNIHSPTCISPNERDALGGK